MWKTQRSTVKGYFLAGGQMVWWPVSIFSITLLVPLGYGRTEKHFCPSRTSFSKQEKKKKSLPCFAKTQLQYWPFFFPYSRLGKRSCCRALATALRPRKSQPAGVQSLSGSAYFDLEICRINWVVPIVDTGFC